MTYWTDTAELAMDGMGMTEFMNCVPELIIVVDERDALRSYYVLENPSGTSRESHPKT